MVTKLSAPLLQCKLHSSNLFIGRYRLKYTSNSYWHFCLNPIYSSEIWRESTPGNWMIFIKEATRIVFINWHFINIFAYCSHKFGSCWLSYWTSFYPFSCYSKKLERNEGHPICGGKITTQMISSWFQLSYYSYELKLAFNHENLHAWPQPLNQNKHITPFQCTLKSRSIVNSVKVLFFILFFLMAFPFVVERLDSCQWHLTFLVLSSAVEKQL